MSGNWQTRLRDIVFRTQAGHAENEDRIDETRREIARFFEETVMPAFYALKEELKKYGREVEIEKSPREAALTVFNGDVEEFSYAIRGHAYHRMTFAYPEIADPSKESRVYRAEVDLGHTETEEFSFSELSMENIIQDFLDHYSEWLER